MNKGIFVTATGTDVGKTYITSLMVKALHKHGCSSGYYKAALSGANNIQDSDAGYVKAISGIPQKSESLLSYCYPDAVSPHLAARKANHPISLSQIKSDFTKVCETYEYVTVEGSGGIICPLCYETQEKIFLTDVIETLGLSTVIVADAGLGTINATVLTAFYLQAKHIPCAGIILNRFSGSEMEEDNRKVITEMTGLPILACVENNADSLSMDFSKLQSLYQEIAP